MYKKIKDHPCTREIYANQLISEGILTSDRAKEIVDNNNTFLDEEFEAGTTFKQNKADWLEGKWTGLGKAHGDARRGKTSCSQDLLEVVGKTITTIPDSFTAHSKLNRIIGARKNAIEAGKGIDWATAEHLAFGSLLLEGYPVRLSGQDSGRGTFSQRHSVFVDQNTEERYVPLSNLDPEQARFEVIDSPLSEAAVMGFEYGYAMAEPNALVMWEAQFGDFANGAQVVIDQFISSGEAKWLRMNGLVLLLPHGYEGQGPEHSSARLERYLQLCAEDNMQVCYPSTPANYFHMLRRQLKRDFRKPLVVMTPKSLLRHKKCVSDIEEFTNGSSFHRVLHENHEEFNLNSVTRVVLCSGKVFYDLAEARDRDKIKNVRILRIEQLYPFPQKALIELLSETPKAELVWCQEEPKNMGGWTFAREHLENVIKDIGMKTKDIIYAGRKEAASPATGSAARHKLEQEALVADALGIKH
jgi:2-oxoglutarate dehydrogenase E1 component